MSRSVPTILLAAAIAVLSQAPSAAATWVIDSSHSGAHFSIRHLMISTVRGEMSKVAGTVEWDEKDPASIKVDATVDVTTINTREPKRDEHLKSPDFFDAAKYPSITFKSRKATRDPQGRIQVTGDLTMHGVTREVTLTVDGPTPAIQDPWGNTKIGASATGRLSRKDFGLTWNKALETGGVVVGDEVDVTIDLELAKKPSGEAKK